MLVTSHPDFHPHSCCVQKHLKFHPYLNPNPNPNPNPERDLDPGSQTPSRPSPSQQVQETAGQALGGETGATMHLAAPPRTMAETHGGVGVAVEATQVRLGEGGVER